MTTGSFDRLTRLRLLYNTLMGERFVWRSLLRELVDMASEAPGFEAVSSAARILLRTTEAGVEGLDLERQVRTIGEALAALEKGLHRSRHPVGRESSAPTPGAV